MRQYLAPIGIWALSVNVVFAFPRDMPFITSIAVVLFLFAGLILAIIFFVVLARAENKRQPAMALLLLLLLGSAWFQGGFRLGAQLHLFVNKSRYETTLRRLLTETDHDQRQTICGNECLVLSDDPIRVGFHFCHAFLNWFDIVYDPSGLVTEKHVSPDRRFNPYHVGGEHLRGEWYLGFFAD